MSWIREWLPFPAMWSSSLGRVPSKRFLVDSSTSTMHASFWLAIVRKATGLPVLTFPDLTRHNCSHQNFHFSSVFQSFLELYVFQVNESKYLVVFTHCRVSVFRWPTFAFLIVEQCLTYLSLFLDTSDLNMDVARPFCKASPGPGIFVWRSFVQEGNPCKILTRASYNSRSPSMFQ